MRNLFCRSLLLLLFGSILVIACSKKKSTYDPELYKTKLSFPFNTPKVSQNVSLEDLRKRVRSLIKEKQSSIKEDISELTYYYIAPQFLSNLGKVDPSIKYDGYWIKFHKNNTFRYGIYNDVLSDGIFHFTPSTELLLMLDNDEDVEPKMWLIKSNSEFINMMGRPIMVIRDHMQNEFILTQGWANDSYLDQVGTILAQAQNGMQIKMQLLDKKPLK